MSRKKIGVLLTNTGTPDELSIGSVRRYLAEFLSDKRVIQLPRPLWLPILYAFVLPVRARRSLHLYKKIWNRDSPIRTFMHSIVQQLQQSFADNAIKNNNENEHSIENDFEIVMGMHYGKPSIKTALHHLHAKNIQQLIVLPLFPQYSNTSTASSFDRVMAALKKWKNVPHHHFKSQYADHMDYIEAIANSIKTYYQTHTRGQHLLISFHGIPLRYCDAGDPYAEQCALTANLLALALQLNQDQWTLCYQSQFGYDRWLTPSTQALLAQLPTRGIKQLDIVSPGFAVDCLETLEEISIRGQHIFKSAGGERLQYIPALNDSSEQIVLLTKMIREIAMRF